MNINEFSNEILEKIFSYLPRNHLELGAAQTCVRWNKLAFNLSKFKHYNTEIRVARIDIEQPQREAEEEDPPLANLSTRFTDQCFNLNDEYFKRRVFFIVEKDVKDRFKAGQHSQTYHRLNFKLVRENQGEQKTYPLQVFSDRYYERNAQRIEHLVRSGELSRLAENYTAPYLNMYHLSGRNFINTMVSLERNCLSNIYTSFMICDFSLIPPKLLENFFKNRQKLRAVDFYDCSSMQNAASVEKLFSLCQTLKKPSLVRVTWQVWTDAQEDFFDPFIRMCIEKENNITCLKVQSRFVRPDAHPLNQETDDFFALFWTRLITWIKNPKRQNHWIHYQNCHAYVIFNYICDRRNEINDIISEMVPKPRIRIKVGYVNVGGQPNTYYPFKRRLAVEADGQKFALLLYACEAAWEHGGEGGGNGIHYVPANMSYALVTVPNYFAVA